MGFKTDIEIAQECTMAVSYTHLDVYKRQCLNGVLWKTGVSVWKFRLQQQYWQRVLMLLF